VEQAFDTLHQTNANEAERKKKFKEKGPKPGSVVTGRMKTF
jgi:hypothetical protein